MKKHVDRLYIIGHSVRRKLKSMNYRYLAKSIFSNCKGVDISFNYVNYRGAHFSRCFFDNVIFLGCDFWGTSFRKCKFRNVTFQDTVFMGCKFKECVFLNVNVHYSAIVNTNTQECDNIIFDQNTIILKQYPQISVTDELMTSLNKIKANKELRKTKVFWISDQKYNALNLFLLMKKYSEKQITTYVGSLTDGEIAKLSTFGSIKSMLHKMVKKGKI